MFVLPDASNICNLRLKVILTKTSFMKNKFVKWENIVLTQLRFIDVWNHYLLKINLFFYDNHFYLVLSDHSQKSDILWCSFHAKSALNSQWIIRAGQNLSPDKVFLSYGIYCCTCLCLKFFEDCFEAHPFPYLKQIKLSLINTENVVCYLCIKEPWKTSRST